MISEAIQTKVAGVVTNTFIHIAPETAVAPFAVHSEAGVPLRTKEGIEGYEYDVNVIIVTASASQRETYAAQVIAAIEALSGTTTNSTAVDEARYISDNPAFDEELELYGTNMFFKVITSNR